ncbi:MAG TPA: YggT family protein [Pyrinomonadaceae bacterium]|jgi:YggT family protein|nr:YggT family protein [Pyrinomonadaceae bacterium]
MNVLAFFQTLVFDERVQPPRALQVVNELIWYLIVAAILTVVVLMLVRFILNYADMNPFSRPVILVRRLTDPYVNPVRRALMGFGIQPNGAPLVVVLLAILLGYLVLLLTRSVLSTAAGVVLSLNAGAAGIVALVGYLLYGLLSLYLLLIVIRIIFSWGQVSYVHPLMSFLVRATDPLLVPLRQMIPPLGMFDISAIIAFIIIWLFQSAIALTLLRGWPPNFF